LIYGGGGIGLMSAVATAVVSKGGNVIGIIPEFLRAWEVGAVKGAVEIIVPSMHARKSMMFEKVKIF
jgi:predicted Rossmann-fold nucleotide-binding protein